MNVAERKYLRRKRVNKIALALSLAAMAFGVFWLVWILFETVRLGFAGLTWATLSLFAPANSITSALANEFAEAGQGMHQAALIYLGLVLFFITFVVLTLSKLLLSQLRKGEGVRT